jgi:transposase-like protein
MTLEDSVHSFRLRVMARAQELGNMTQACREFGISRALFYRWRKRYLAYGRDRLHPSRQGPRRGWLLLISV